MHKKELKRISQVVKVLLKNGLGYLVDELSLKLHLPFTKRFLMKRSSVDDLAVRLRKSMEELGGAYIKLGQLLSLRPDLIPIEFCDEFRKLLDEVPSEKFDKIKTVIEKSLGKKISTMFKHVDSKPVGSASVAQVHKAKLLNGKEIVIKVLRPGVKEKFLTDITILRYIASKVENRFHNLPVKVSKIVEEFEKYTRNELNLIYEARNIERFAKQKHSVNIIIPKVYWPATSKKVLTMDYVPGRKLSHVRHADKKFAEIILNEVLKELFDYGFFHADIHPGNVILTPNDKVGLIDFGIVGFVDKTTKTLALNLYTAIVKKDVDGVFKLLLKYGSVTRSTNLQKLKQEVFQEVNEWYEGEGKETRATHVLHQIFISCTKNNLALPGDSVLFAKTLITTEGTCNYIDPNFNFIKYAQKRANKILSKYSSAAAMRKYVVEEAKHMADVAKAIPEKSLDVLKKLDTGRFSFTLDDAHFRRIGFNISTSSNRLSYALIITGLIVASALLMEIGPFIDGYPIFSIIGLILAGILMVPLFLSILHEPKKPEQKA